MQSLAGSGVTPPSILMWVLTPRGWPLKALPSVSHFLFLSLSLSSAHQPATTAMLSATLLWFFLCFFFILPAINFYHGVQRKQNLQPILHRIEVVLLPYKHIMTAPTVCVWEVHWDTDQYKWLNSYSPSAEISAIYRRSILCCCSFRILHSDHRLLNLHLIWSFHPSAIAVVKLISHDILLSTVTSQKQFKLKCQ